MKKLLIFFLIIFNLNISFLWSMDFGFFYDLRQAQQERYEQQAQQQQVADEQSEDDTLQTQDDKVTNETERMTRDAVVPDEVPNERQNPEEINEGGLFPGSFLDETNTLDGLSDSARHFRFPGPNQNNRREVQTPDNRRGSQTPDSRRDAQTPGSRRGAQTPEDDERTTEMPFFTRSNPTGLSESARDFNLRVRVPADANNDINFREQHDVVQINVVQINNDSNNAIKKVDNNNDFVLLGLGLAAATGLAVKTLHQYSINRKKRTNTKINTKIIWTDALNTIQQSLSLDQRSTNNTENIITDMFYVGPNILLKEDYQRVKLLDISNEHINPEYSCFWNNLSKEQQEKLKNVIMTYINSEISE